MTTISSAIPQTLGILLPANARDQPSSPNQMKICMKTRVKEYAERSLSVYRDQPIREVLLVAYREIHRIEKSSRLSPPQLVLTFSNALDTEIDFEKTLDNYPGLTPVVENCTPVFDEAIMERLLINETEGVRFCTALEKSSETIDLLARQQHLRVNIKHWVDYQLVFKELDISLKGALKRTGPSERELRVLFNSMQTFARFSSNCLSHYSPKIKEFAKQSINSQMTIGSERAVHDKCMTIMMDYLDFDIEISINSRHVEKPVVTSPLALLPEKSDNSEKSRSKGLLKSVHNLFKKAEQVCTKGI